ncbi:MAG: hypothetical protein J6T29_04055 [Alphaproteobacteria bacterium]|nr:hypothetical protein [Alphaproteobacteria bacterium]
MRFKLPFFGKRKVGYDIRGENNKIIIVEEDGTERELGKDERIEGLNVIIHGNENLIKIDSSARFNASFELNTNNCQIQIGKNVNLTNSRINFWKKANNSNVKIGNNFSTGGMEIAFSQGNSSLVIADDCIASSHIIFWVGDGHEILKDGSVINDSPVQVEIGKHSWIGYNSIFTKNASLAENTIVAANSVVTKVFTEKNIVIAGNPAQIVKTDITWRN